MKKLVSPAALCIYAAVALTTITVFIMKRRTNSYA